MISLEEALNLTNPIDDEDSFYIRQTGTDKSEIFNSIESVQQSFDVKNTKVIKIRPRFYEHEYAGIEIEILWKQRSNHYEKEN